MLIKEGEKSLRDEVISEEMKETIDRFLVRLLRRQRLRHAWTFDMDLQRIAQ
jgi:hypothetical protein